MKNLKSILRNSNDRNNAETHTIRDDHRIVTAREELLKEFPDAKSMDRLLENMPDMTWEQAAVYVAGYVDGYAEAIGLGSIG